MGSRSPASQTLTRFPGCSQISWPRGLYLAYTMLYRMGLSSHPHHHPPEKPQKGNGFFPLGFLCFLILTKSEGLASTVQVLRGRGSGSRGPSRSAKASQCYQGTHMHTPSFPGAPEGIRIPPPTPLCFGKVHLHNLQSQGNGCRMFAGFLAFPALVPRCPNTPSKCFSPPPATIRDREKQINQIT